MTENGVLSLPEAPTPTVPTHLRRVRFVTPGIGQPAPGDVAGVVIKDVPRLPARSGGGCGACTSCTAACITECETGNECTCPLP